MSKIAQLNRTVFIACLTEDLETQPAETGKVEIRTRVVIDDTTFVPVVLTEKTSGLTSISLAKDTHVLIEGSLDSRKQEDVYGTRTLLEVVALSIQPLIEEDQ